MKRIIFTVSFITLICNFTHAQSLPNGGFEDWGTVDPVGWATLNWLSDFGVPPTITQTTDAYSGSTAMKIETIKYGADTVDGVAFTGTWPLSVAPKFGFPFASRPGKLKGHYKYSTMNNDSCGVIVWMTKWNTALQKKDSIASGFFWGKPVSTYTFFEVPITYHNAGVPDTATVLVLGSAQSSIDHRGLPGNILYIDELTFEYATGISEPLFSDNTIKVYPTMVTNTVTFYGDLSSFSRIIVTDVTGKIVYKTPLKQDERVYTLDVRSFNCGKYFYLLEGSAKSEKGVFIVQK